MKEVPLTPQNTSETMRAHDRMATQPTLLRTTLVSGATAAIVCAGMLGAYDALRAPAPPAMHRPLQAGDAPLQTETSTTITDVAQRTEPAVASVVISRDAATLGRFFGRRLNGRDELEVGGGTAFFVTADGLLLTNRHVVDDEKATYTVFLNDGRKLDATVVARDPVTDIALLQVEGKDFPHLTISRDDRLLLGQTVIAIGNALAEFRNTVSVGVIAGIGRSIEASGARSGPERLSRIIQTDAAINPGNSGGPLINTLGEVIGMNTAVAEGAENIGFAIPASDLRIVLESYKANGRIVRPQLGIRYTLIDDELQKAQKLSEDHGVLIIGKNDSDAVLPGSPADRAGLRMGDIITAVDGRELSDDEPLADIIQQRQPGDSVTLRVSRGGRQNDVVVQLDEWKSEFDEE